MSLTTEQARHLHEQGYVKLPGAVPGELVERALRRINQALAQGMDPALMWQYNAQTFFPEITKVPEVTDLYNESAAAPAVTAALGLDELLTGTRGQIALRFPSKDDSTKVQPPHIDGTYHPHNGVPEGSFQSFTCLCGVFLTELAEPNRGNFTVWPGTHFGNAAYAREHGWQSISTGIPKMELPAPVQIEASPGDVVIAHHLLGHGVAPHLGPHVRYACFFRIHHPLHHEHQAEALVDPWFEWDGLRAQLGLTPVTA